MRYTSTARSARLRATGLPNTRTELLGSSNAIGPRTSRGPFSADATVRHGSARAVARFTRQINSSSRYGGSKMSMCPSGGTLARSTLSDSPAITRTGLDASAAASIVSARHAKSAQATTRDATLSSCQSCAVLSQEDSTRSSSPCPSAQSLSRSRSARLPDTTRVVARSTLDARNARANRELDSNVGRYSCFIELPWATCRILRESRHPVHTDTLLCDV